MKNCIFCQIVEGKIPSNKVYEDEQYLAFLDINPVNPGHTLVIPKEHFPDLVAAPLDTAVGLMRVVKNLAPIIAKAVNADGFNLGLNNGRAAGQLVEHIHLHIMPRFPGDGHSAWSGRPYADGEAAKVAEKIRSTLK